MKPLLALTAAILLISFSPGALLAKGAGAGIYGIVDDVTLKSDTIRIAGVFVVPRPMSSGEYQAPRRGFLYFRIQGGVAEDVARKKCRDLITLARTGKVVAFGPYWVGQPDGSNHSLEVRVRTNGDTGLPELLPLSEVRTAPDDHDPGFNTIAAQLTHASGTP